MIAFTKAKSLKEVYYDLLQTSPDAKIVIGFEKAYIGMTATYPVIAVYDYDECVRALQESDKCCKEEADATLGDIIEGCVGPDCPVFVRCC
jgi:hypothetical protein